jgi:hypothetical protein
MRAPVSSVALLSDGFHCGRERVVASVVVGDDPRVGTERVAEDAGEINVTDGLVAAEGAMSEAWSLQLNPVRCDSVVDDVSGTTSAFHRVQAQPDGRGCTRSRVEEETRLSCEIEVIHPLDHALEQFAQSPSLQHILLLQISPAFTSLNQAPSFSPHHP